MRGGESAARQECAVYMLRHRQTLLSTRLGGRRAICYRFLRFTKLRRHRVCVKAVDSVKGKTCGLEGAVREG